MKSLSLKPLLQNFGIIKIGSKASILIFSFFTLNATAALVGPSPAPYALVDVTVGSVGDNAVNLTKNYALNNRYSNFPSPLDELLRKPSTLGKTAAVDTFEDLLSKPVRSLALVGVATAAAAAAGYIIDELTGQVLRPVSAPAEGYIEGVYWRADNRYFASTPTLALKTFLDTAYSVFGTYTIVLTGVYSTANAYRVTFENGVTINTNVTRHGCGAKLDPYCTENPLDEISNEPVSDTDLAKDMWDQLKNLSKDHPIWRELLKNTGGQWVHNPSDGQAVSDHQDDFADSQPDWSYDPATDSMTYTDPVTGTTTTVPNSTGTGYTHVTNSTSNSTSITNNTSTGSTTNTTTNMTIEWPVFCTWATPVCTFIDWMYAPGTITDPDDPSDIFGDIPVIGDLPDFDTPDLPDFLPDNGGCQTITLAISNSDGTSASQIFPTPIQCSRLQQGQTMIGWFLYVVTWFGVVYIIFGIRRA